MKYKHYTVGFLFNIELTKVMLIKKAKPEWQKGFYNGVGGKFEGFENAGECMSREFHEETGIGVIGWVEFALGYISCHQGPCALHYMVNLAEETKPKKDTIEQAKWFGTNTMKEGMKVPNLRWLVPMASLKLTTPHWEEPGKIVLY